MKETTNTKKLPQMENEGNNKSNVNNKEDKIDIVTIQQQQCMLRGGGPYSLNRTLE